MEKVMPLSSLRLLAPSLRVMQAVMWKVVHQRNTKHYGKVERFVSLVTEAIPDILTDRQIRLLTLGLRAKMILHTVCSEQSKDLVQTHLDGLLLTCTKQTLPEQGALEVNFVRLVEGLLKDPKEREHFLENVFPVEYGPNFDTALESLVYLFFARLEELVLIPNFKQIAAWIGDASSVLDEYIECLTSTQDLSVLLRSKEHHGNVAKMDSSAPSPSEQQLFSSLSLRTPLSATNTKDLESNAQNQPGANGFQDTSDREDNDSQQSLNSSDADQTTEEMCNDVAPDVPTMEENNERASSKSAVTPLMSSSATWHPRQRVAHKCTHCGKCFIYRWELLVHQRLHTGETPYTCSQCGKVFRRTSGLCHHRRTRCKNAAYICIKCRGSFQSIQDRHRHKCVQEFVCSHCGKSFKQNYLLVKHEQTHTQDSIFRCRHCGESFSCVAFLAAHKLQHKQQQTKVCVHCGKAFRSKTDLNMHVRRHTDEKPFHCTHCGKRFSNSGNLNMHIQIHTRKIKSYMCTDCGKVFISESRLQVHRRSHTGERPFECTHCGKLFSMAGNLTVHIRLHTGEKPYLCADCGKGFVSAGELQIHRRSHTGEKPYKCTICDRRFIKASKVTVHMRVHTGERPYVCTECGKGFSRGSELNKHAMKHTGVRPYACRFCAKTYTRSNHLKTHLKTHSVIKSQSV